MARNVITKVAVGAAAIGLLGFLFVRSALNVQSSPYTVEAGHVTPWTLALQSASTPSGAILVLRAPQGMATDLFGQIFSRMSESLSAPNPMVMPLLLRDELERALSASATPDTLLALARETGLESTTPTLRCLATRRISQPGVTRQMFAAIFDFPAFQEFRQQVRQRWPSAGDAPFDPLALSPVALVAATDADFESWSPIRLKPESDCLAPITVE